ncbi:MAG: hypothetical protein WB816_01855 [Methylocystis sp.]
MTKDERQAEAGARILVEPRHEWWRSAVERLEDLCKLPMGWDGYDAPPIAFENALFAAEMLVAMCPLSAPEPAIVPGAEGDLQVEWLTEDVDIELRIRAPYDVEACRADGPTPEHEVRLHLTTDFSAVFAWLAELPETSQAAFDPPPRHDNDA